MVPGRIPNHLFSESHFHLLEQAREKSEASRLHYYYGNYVVKPFKAEILPRVSKPDSSVPMLTAASETLTRTRMFISISQMDKQAQRSTDFHGLSHSFKAVAALKTHVCRRQNLCFLHSRPQHVDWLSRGGGVRLKKCWCRPGGGGITMEPPGRENSESP